jgi:hypothetical protein
MMNIKVSRKWWLSIAATLGMLILLWAIGTAMAQGPGPEGDLQPQGDISAAATLNSRISYQGVLEEDGSPVTGTRNMVFNFYTNDTCSGVAVLQVIKNGVQVTNGLFSVELDVTHSVFWGHGLWLEVEVEGSPVSCQEILPVPYALSLRPGAEIEGEPTAWEGWVLKVTMDGTYPLGKAVLGSTATGSAVYGKSSGGYGVYGYSEDGYAVSGHDSGSTQAKGYGGYFTSDNGVGVYGYSGADRIVSNNYAPGVYGRSAKGAGVYGVSESSAGSMAGVYGQASTGSAVRGTSPGGLGLYGYSENNYAIQGTSDQSEGGHFTSNEGYGIRVNTDGDDHWDHGGYFTANWGYGIYVMSTHNNALRAVGGNDLSGVSQPGGTVGVAGLSAARTGVWGSSRDSNGVYGISETDSGVYGKTNGEWSWVSGVYGKASKTNAIGVTGWNTGAGNGVYAYSETGTALIAKSESGNLIEAWDTSPSDRRFLVTNAGAAYADGGWLGAADFAELMSTEGDSAAYEPGDVLVISVESDRAVALSSAPYSTMVIGVYSEKPGFVGSSHVMEGQRDDEIPVAVVGIVPCKVSAENGPIHRGDLLVTSSTSGHAMRADDPSPGTILGKALEEFDGDRGVIQILVVLQ